MQFWWNLIGLMLVVVVIAYGIVLTVERGFAVWQGIRRVRKVENRFDYSWPEPNTYGLNDTAQGVVTNLTKGPELDRDGFIRLDDAKQPGEPTIALPSEVIDYCEEESEAFAQDECKLRASTKFGESADWDVVLTSLQREDGVIR